MKVTILLATLATIVSFAAAEPIVLYCPAEGHVPNMQLACYNLPCACWQGEVHCEPSEQYNPNHDEMVRQCEDTCKCFECANGGLLPEPIQRNTPPPDYCKKTPGKRNVFSGAVDKCKRFITKKKGKRATFQS